jgi:choline dehydrogenase-like flavoprotein
MKSNKKIPHVDVYDAIVIGSGMSGGYAAKEFCEKGYKTLVLDRGKPLNHREYKTEFKAPWEMDFRGKVPQETLDKEYAIQKDCYAINDFNKHNFINDRENPYVQEKPFSWIRSSHVGGKSILWARQSYRWCKQDFESNAQDGHGVDWPIRYKDIEPWYDYVEPFIGISGSEENLAELPDGKFLPAQPMNIVEREIKEKIENTFKERKVIPARVAHLTDPQPVHLALGRGQCQARSECDRGCSFGGYYSSLAGALPAAERTGNMTLTANAQAQEVLFDEATGKASGVKYVDTVTKETIVVHARVVFVCASTLGSVQILLNSTSNKYPNGIGNTSNILGHYIMDHLSGAGATGTYPGHLDSYYKGRRPGGVYIPRFQNWNNKTNDKHTANNYLRGYGFQGDASRTSWQVADNKSGVGADFKESNKQPGNWKFSVYGFGEMLPNYDNKVTLHKTKTDDWGLPLLVTNVEYSQNDRNLINDAETSAIEMLEAAGVKDIKPFNSLNRPGLIIHEMGGACMGKDPKTSYLNKWNQSHEVPNLFVTDGASFSSVSCVNPSITFMALTARAVDYADKLIKDNII